MLKNYLKTAWRNLWKGRLFNSMNIVGLSVAVASSTLLLLTVYFEFSYDNFHKNGNNIYQLYFMKNRTGVPELNSSMPVPLTPALKADYPAVKYITRYGVSQATVTFGDKQIDQNLIFTEPDFFKMFTFPIVNGSKQALSHLNDIVLTKASAKAIFGDADPVGKTVSLKYGDKPTAFLVSGIINDIPENSSIKGDIFARFENVPGYEDNTKHWDNQNHLVFLQLNNNTTPQAFEAGLSPFVQKNMAQSLSDLKRDGAKILPNGDRQSLNLTPFLHSHTNTEVNGMPGGQPISTTYIIALLIIAIFILIIACINFINLAVARSFTRAREIGVRKTLGAAKSQLLFQFWIEALLICLIAFVIGIALAAAVLPGFNASFRSHISLLMLLQPLKILAVLSLFLLITILAGLYPALLVMRYKTTQVLKGSVNTTKPGRVRNILLVVQFSIATILTICTLITWQQITYLQSKPLGYSKTEVISIPVGQKINGATAVKLFSDKLSSDPAVVGVSGGYSNMGRGNDGSMHRSILGFNYNGHEVLTHEEGVYYNYAKALGLKLIAGRDFSKDYSADSNSVVINEKMAALIGNGKNVVGTYLPMHSDQEKMQVIGVVKDYNFQSLHEEIEPMSLTLTKQYPIGYVFVRLKSANLRSDFDHIKAAWHQTFPNIEFIGSWLDENTEKQYKSEQRLSTIFVSASIIAIIISCIGLFAISVMVIIQRTKEIGIRKVLGASVGGIVMLISNEFVKLVLIATVIAFPIGWFVMHKWLEGFAYRISIHWWIFALSAFMALVIALLTISYQAIKAALATSVKSLKSE